MTDKNIEKMGSFSIKIKFDKHQLSAIKNIVESKEKIVILCGSAGRGKTTVANEILRTLFDIGYDPLKVYICAPTGKAAVVVNSMLEDDRIHNQAVTIHRLLGCKGAAGWDYNRDNQLKADFLLVEEFSLVDVELTARLIESVSENCKILFSGDDSQLFPVGAGCPFYDLIQANKSGQVNKLITNYRQKGGELLGDGIEKILHGKLPTWGTRGKDTMGKGKPDNIFLIEVEDKDDVAEKMGEIIQDIETGGYIDGDEVPHDGVDWMALSPTWKNSAGVDYINGYLQELLNPQPTEKEFIEMSGSDDPGNWEIYKVPELKIYGKPFRQGDRVKQTKNDYLIGSNGAFNGFTGVLMQVNNMGANPEVLFNGNELIEYEKPAQLNNLALGYITTVHSSQGSQWDHVVFVCHSTHYYQLSRSLLYVAASRARKSLTIIGDKKGIARALKNDTKNSRDTFLKMTFAEMENEE